MGCEPSVENFSRKALLLSFLLVTIFSLFILIATHCFGMLVANGNGGGGAPQPTQPQPEPTEPEPEPTCECYGHSQCGSGWCCFDCVCDPCGPSSCIDDSQCGNNCCIGGQCRPCPGPTTPPEQSPPTSPPGSPPQSPPSTPVQSPPVSGCDDDSDCWPDCCINGQCRPCTVQTCSDYGYYSTRAACVNDKRNRCNCEQAILCESVSVADLTCYDFRGCNNDACTVVDRCNNRDSNYFNSESRCLAANSSKCDCPAAVRCKSEWICFRVINTPDGPECIDEELCYTFSNCTNSVCQTATPTTCNCSINSDCNIGYFCKDNCYCEICQQYKRCRDNAVWLYSDCDGWLYETDNCSNYAGEGPCNIQKCVALTLTPTYKRVYKNVTQGICVPGVPGATGSAAYARCSTKTSEEECSGLAVYCAFGCLENTGIPNCLPRAIITSNPPFDESTKTLLLFEGTLVELSCLDSIDSDGNIVLCEWSVDSLVYNSKKINLVVKLGSSVVTLKACDNLNYCDTEKLVINGIEYDSNLPTDPTGKPLLDNLPPLACFTISPSSKSGYAGITEFKFDASCSTDPDENDFITSYSWDFGDGHTAIGKIVTHVYADDGSKNKIYTVTLIVTDNGKNGKRPKLSSMATDKVIIGKEIGKLKIVANPNEGVVPLIVLFVIPESQYRNMFTKYIWNFGDGIKREGTHEILHGYRSEGTYTASVIASNLAGYYAYGSTSVKVYGAKGITNLHVKDTYLYGTAKISLQCVSPATVELEYGTERNKTKLVGFPCNVAAEIGPFTESGQHSVTAKITGCDAVECEKSTSFYVSPGFLEVKVNENNILLIIVISLVVILFVRHKKAIKNL
ncbi:MAG: PKD domain-containing protein [Candidatus Diapherotrites archaeon]